MASRPSAAPTPLPRTSSLPQSPVRDASPPPQQPVPFPPPQTFDALPQLHGLLLRLLAPQTAAEGPSDGARAGDDATRPSSAGPGQSQTQHQQQPLVAGNENSGSNGVPRTIPSSAAPGASVAAEIAALGPNAPPPLDAKNLPTEASSTKIRIQKMQAVVDGLPDVHRYIEEQEREIEELEGRIAKLKSTVSEFGRSAGT